MLEPDSEVAESLFLDDDFDGVRVPRFHQVQNLDAVLFDELRAVAAADRPNCRKHIVRIKVGLELLEIIDRALNFGERLRKVVFRERAVLHLLLEARLNVVEELVHRRDHLLLNQTKLQEALLDQRLWCRNEIHFRALNLVAQSKLCLL